MHPIPRGILQSARVDGDARYIRCLVPCLCRSSANSSIISLSQVQSTATSLRRQITIRMSGEKATLAMKNIEVEKNDAIHVEAESISTTSSNMEQVDKTKMTAKQQYAQLWAALKADSRYSWWALYCMLLVFGWGYDAGLSGVAIAFPEFREVYGNYYQPTGEEGQYVIPALWQSLWNAASTIGQVFGGFAAGQFADMVGRKALLYTAVALSLSSSFALVFAPSTLR